MGRLQARPRWAPIAMLTRLALAAALLSSCNERSSPTPPGAPASAGPNATAGAPAPDGKAADTWIRVTKDGRELGVVELLAGEPWRVVLHSQSEDARALSKLVSDQGAKPISLSMHLPPEKKGERGPYGSRLVSPGDPLYRFAVEELLGRSGFTPDGAPPRFQDKNPPASVSKLELSRDGAKVGTLDLSAQPPKLTLVNREANALFLESFWQGLEREEQLTVSYLPPEGGKDALVTVSAKKGTPEHAKVVRLAFAVRYPAYALVVTP